MHWRTAWHGGTPCEAVPVGNPPTATEPAPGGDLANEEGAGLAPEFLPGNAVNAPTTVPGDASAANLGSSLSPDPGAAGPSAGAVAPSLGLASGALRVRPRRPVSPPPVSSDDGEYEEDYPEPTQLEQLEQRNRDLEAAVAQRDAALASVERRLSSLEGNVAAAQNTVRAPSPLTAARPMLFVSPGALRPTANPAQPIEVDVAASARAAQRVSAFRAAGYAGGHAITDTNGPRMPSTYPANDVAPSTGGPNRSPTNRGTHTPRFTDYRTTPNTGAVLHTDVARRIFNRPVNLSNPSDYAPVYYGDLPTPSHTFGAPRRGPYTFPRPNDSPFGPVLSHGDGGLRANPPLQSTRAASDPGAATPRLYDEHGRQTECPDLPPGFMIPSPFARAGAPMMYMPNQYSSYKKGLPPPDKWTDNSVASGRRAITFLEDYELYCSLQGFDPAALFPSYLTGRARDLWFQSMRDTCAITNGAYPTWPVLKEQFIQYTGEDLFKDIDSARQKLLTGHNLSMKPGTSLQSYVTDFRNTYILAGTLCMDNAMMVSAFMRGLASDLRTPVTKDLLALNNPTLDDVIKITIQNHKAIIACAGIAMPPPPPKKTATSVPQVAALRREVGGPSRPASCASVPTVHGSPANDHSDPGGEPTTNCLWCGLDGHWVPDCPKKAAGLTPEQAQRQLGTLTLVRKLREAIAAKRAAKAKRPASNSGRGGSSNSRGTVDGHHAMFLCDTGATHSFISADFASAHNLPVYKYAVERTWLLADNASLSCNGFVSVPLSLPGHHARCKLTVMPQFVKGYDVLLGDDWLFANQATLSYEHKTLSLSRPGEPTVQLPCHSAVPPAAIPAIKQPMVTPPPAFLISAIKATVPMATAKVAARWLRKGGRAVVAVISPDGSATPEPEVTPHGLPDAIKAQLDALLAEYSDVFTPLTGLPPDRPVGHTIPLEPGNRPPATPIQGSNVIVSICADVVVRSCTDVGIDICTAMHRL
ncbi:Zf-CCHC domain-containing protein/RVP_2 domain-containing protein, partial [Haematococcus lacustris]